MKTVIGIIIDTPYGEYLHCAATGNIEDARKAFKACYRRNPEIKPQWNTMRVISPLDRLDEIKRLKAKYPNRLPLRTFLGSKEKIFEHGHLLPGSKLKPPKYLAQIAESPSWGTLASW